MREGNWEKFSSFDAPSLFGCFLTFRYFFCWILTLQHFPPLTLKTMEIALFKLSVIIFALFFPCQYVTYFSDPFTSQGEMFHVSFLCLSL